MIISRTPFRISFFGGGTDYPAWYREHGGNVLSTTIDKYCYISCRYLPPFFDYKSRILYSKIEIVKDHRDIKHPAVRAVLQDLGIKDGLEIHHDGDLPARTGLGSSSAFVVGILHALAALKQRMPSAMELSREAIHIEQHVLAENVGCQDQVITAYGGFNRIDFHPNDSIHISPLIISLERQAQLHSHFLLFFTGFSRTASRIVKEQLVRMKDKTGEMKRMQEMVDESIAMLTGSGDLTDFGRLMGESWRIKRSLSPHVSTPAIDRIYEQACSAGALGGKILGAGGGGFMLLFAKPEKHPAIIKKLNKILRVPFNFEEGGSRIVVYQPGAVDSTPSGPTPGCPRCQPN